MLINYFPYKLCPICFFRCFVIVICLFPARGSQAKNILLEPLRSYSVSKRSGLPGFQAPWEWEPACLLFTGFVHAHSRKFCVIRSLINIQYILHFADKICAGLRKAPFFFLPGLQFVFFQYPTNCLW